MKGMGKAKGLLWITVSTLVLSLLVLPATPASAGDEALDAAFEIATWLKDAVGTTQEIAALVAEIERARNDPGALSGESYARIYEEITKQLLNFVGAAVDLPPHIQHAVLRGSKEIAKLIESTTDGSLGLVRKRFRQNLVVYDGDVWKAAQASGMTRQVQLWAALDWLSSAREPIVGSWQRHDGLIVIIWQENDEFIARIEVLSSDAAKLGFKVGQIGAKLRRDHSYMNLGKGQGIYVGETLWRRAGWEGFRAGHSFALAGDVMVERGPEGLSANWVRR
jgi:hypothetical protein